MTVNPDTTPDRIGQIAINVENLTRAVAFYRDVLGLKHLFDAGDRMSFFDCGGVRLMLSLPEKIEFDHPSSIVYYHVANIQASHAKLVERLSHVDSEPRIVAAMPDHDLWMSNYKDTEGNPFALMMEAKKS